MPLAIGSRLGPYEVAAALGSGGMGEVYRARDTRLGRDVALKVLPAEHARDSERQKRFESEARAVAALDHPNILALHDVGNDGGRPYVVFELVEGLTLREKLARGRLPVSKAVEYAIQVCRGLVAAHARGIVHRDLKPENLSLTRDGRVKILDFGLARLLEPDLSAPLGESQARTATVPGVALGTAGYMSPEQARGTPADARSDLFSLGAILYEMVSGRRAFDAATPTERLSAVLLQDPPELAVGVDPAPTALVRIVRRCLQKEPDDRFQTARDLGFALESLSGASSPTATGAARSARASHWLGFGAAALVVSAIVATVALWGSRRSDSFPVFKQLTFRRGTILDARFTRDGHTVAYSALFDGNAVETYSMRLDAPEALRLDMPPARLFGVSASGELAVLLGHPGERQLVWSGTLARVPFSGGAPRAVVDDVWAADWSPDGQELAVIRLVDGVHQLEYPPGHLLRRPAEVIGAGAAMRVSPRGDRVAFTTAGGVIVVDRAGRAATFKVDPWADGLAWDPSGDAFWVGISPDGSQSTGLWRIDLDGRRREAARVPGPVMIHDLSRDGRFLVHLGFERLGVRARAPGESVERDLCPLSYCQPIVLSGDGRQLLVNDFSDRSPSRSPNGTLFLRPTVGGPTVRLGEGGLVAFSADGRWTLVDRSEPGRPALDLVPVGSGASKRLNTEGLDSFGTGFFLDAGHALIPAAGSDRRWRSHLIDLAGAKPTAVTPAFVFAVPGSARGGSVIGAAAEGTLAWYSLSGGESRPIAIRRPPGTLALGVSADTRFLFIGQEGVPGRLDRLDLETGQRLHWKTLLPDDPAGVVSVGDFSVTPDGSAYAYTYLRFFQDLYLIEGVR